MAEKWGDENDHKLVIAFIGFLALVLVQIIALSGPVLISNFFVTPSFQTASSSDFSSISVTNVGRAAAHQVKITLILPGNQTGFSEFSSENATWLKSFDSLGNQTIIVANMPRLAEQGFVSVKFAYPTRTMEIWVNSNERGIHQLIVKGAPPPTQTVDYAPFLQVASASAYIVFIVYGYRRDIRDYLRRRTTKRKKDQT